MSKLTTAEDKLLKRGFDWATDSNGYDPSWDEMDVLEFLKLKPGTEAKDININIPRHRIVAAFKRLETAGKLPTVEPLDSFTKTKELQANYLKLVNPVCSKGNDERSCVNDETEPGTLVKILDSDGLWKIDTIKDGHAKLDLVEGDRKLPKRRRVALHKLRVNVETVEPPKRNDYDSLVSFVIDYREWENNNPDQVDPDQLMPGTKIKLTDDSIAEIVEPINPPGCFINAVRSGETLQVADGDYVVLGESVQSVYDIPHWLTGKNAAEAKALIDSNKFCYIGTVDQFDEPDDSCTNYGDWQIYYNQFFIEARCNGAVFNREESDQPDNELVDKAIATIKKAAEDWGLQFGQQLELKLDDCEQSQNILLTDPPRQVDANGQLSIFFDDSEEPPDPDDFETGEEYEQAYDKWAALYPEIERAINQAKVKQFENTHWSTGDYVQLISDPRRIGQLIGIKNGGLYKIKFADGFVTELKADTFLDQPFCKENSEVVLGESFFKVGEFVVTSAPGFEDKIFKVEKIYHTGMIGVIDKSNQSFSFPANWLNHYVEKVGKSKGKILENSERKRPAKGCGSGSLVIRQANKKRNAAKGRDPDIYYVYCYSYTDNYGKEIKSSISVPREKIAHVKGMIERKEHYVKIAKFLGKSLPCYY